MLSKGQQIQFLTKSTFKSSSPLVPLIDQLFAMIPKLRGLFGRNIFDQFVQKEIKLLCLKLPKPIERSQHTIKELEICQELKAVIQDFGKSKRNRKYKPYNLLLLWKSFEEIIISRIKNGVRGRLDSVAEDPENFKLFSLVKEIEDTTSLFYEWAQQHSGKGNPVKKDGVEFVYPQSASKTDGKTNRITIDSTAVASGKLSKYDKGSTFEDIKQFNKASPECNLLRASTAKLERKPIKMNVRCPSAVHVLKNQQFKKPSFELRNSKRKRTKHRTQYTTEMEKAIDGLQNFDFNEQSSTKTKKSRFKKSFLSKKNSKKLQKDKSEERKKKKVSILDKEFGENEESGSSKHSETEFLSIKLLQEGESEMVAASKTSSQIQVGRKSGNTRNEDQNIESQDNFDNEEESSPSGENLSQNQHSSVNIEAETPLTSEHSSDIDDELLFKIKQKRVQIKRSRRSGQFFSQEDSWVKVCELNQTNKSMETKKSIKSNKSRRRAALISSKKLTKNDISDEDLPCAKTLEFDQNVMLAAQNASRKKRTEYLNKAKKQIPTTASFNNFFAELNGFLSRDQFLYQENYGSIFFRQQRKLKDHQDQAMRQKLNHLMLDNRQMFSNIFEMTNKTSLNKDVIYSQIHRGEAFTSDKEWIRHNFQCEDPLVQKSL